MRAVKGNREYVIDESQKKWYQDSGFDILDDTGKIIAYGRGKTVPYDDHMRTVRENEALRKRIAEMESAESQEDAEPVKKAGAKKASD